MARVERSPLAIPAGIEVSVNGQLVKVKGKKGALERHVDPGVQVVFDEAAKVVKFLAKNKTKKDMAVVGTARALVKNMIAGIHEGYSIKLLLEGVGYRAQVKGKILNLSVGFSHPVEYPIPDGVIIETPSNTEIILSGSDKQLVGQAAAVIRGFQPPEPYKGKGIKYEKEFIIRKEGKKK